MLADLPESWVSEPPDPLREIIARALPGAMHGTRLQRVDRGVYLGHLNVIHDIRRFVANEWPEWDGPWEKAPFSYGVADSHEQIIERWGDRLQGDPRPFAVFLTPIIREEEPAEGGWRWHKWGDYIGTQAPEHEYLYNDTHIDKVYVFRIYELKEATE